MECHGNQEREIAYALNISSLKRSPTQLPNNPDYVPSIYPETIAKKSGCVANVSSLARFERAQRCSATNEMERLTNEKDEERRFLFAQRTLKAFKNDHGSYCKASTEQPCNFSRLFGVHSQGNEILKGKQY